MASRIPYGRHDIDESDIAAVAMVLRSEFLTQGPVVPRFEEAVAKHCGARYAVAVNSATSALHIACLALGVGKGDIVWTSPITFVASANCALYCGASVDFVDIDPRTYNLSIGHLTEKLDRAVRTGTLPKVLIAVHLCGQPCNMIEIQALSQKYGFKILEDASHAIGGAYKGQPIGNCRYSDITIFSFHPVKIITTGEGGMALTNDEQLRRRLVRLRSHGITRDATEMNQAPDGLWFYQQVELGFNYRMTDIQAALGLSQLTRLDAFVARRHALAAYYNEALISTPIVTPWQQPESYSGLHLYVVRLPQNKSKLTKAQIFQTLWQSGIEVNLHYIPIYRQPFYQKMGFERSDFPEAESYYAEAITLPLYPTLRQDQQAKVVAGLIELLAN